MRVLTEGKHEMGRRFAIVIGVAAAGVMALGAQTATSTTGPDLQLSGPKKQSLRQGDSDTHACIENERCQAHVKVKASCGDAACSARAKGKLTKVKTDKLKPLRDLASAELEAGELGDTLVLKLTKSQRKQVRKALNKGENVKAKVTVRAKDAAGNVATAKRTIKLVK
jgi:hypothetical protein